MTEFAEEYSAEARIKIVLLGLSAGGSLILVSKLWLLPSLVDFLKTAPCRQVHGGGGLPLVWYGLFVGMPLVAAALTAVLLGRRGRRILRDGQVPPIGEKVFRPTPIRRGPRAVLVGRLHMLACLPFFVLALWGFFQAQEMAVTTRTVPGQCAIQAQ